MKKKLLAILITLSMVVCAMTATAFAETTGVSYMKWDDGQKMLVSDTCNSYTKVTADDTTWAASGGNNGWYVVEGEITINHTVTITGDVKLILCDGCSLAVKGEDGTDEEPITDGRDAIKGTGNITIYGQSNCTGALTAQGGKGGSDTFEGKSGGRGFNADGAVIINGGTVTAHGGQGGNGECMENEIDDGEGNVMTTHDSQAGLGGNGIFGKTVTVNGGTVNAYGGNGGDVHGSSAQGLQADTYITINGGTVYAEAGKGSAGMRTDNGNTGTITINGGDVTARGSKDDDGGNGIETGNLTVGSNIKIVGGSKYDLTNDTLQSKTADVVRNNCYYVHTKLTAPILNDRFGGTGLTKDSYTQDAVPTQDCHARTQGYTFAGWSTVIDDESKIISGEPEGGETYYAVWKKSGKTVITTPLNFTLNETQSAYSTETNGIKWDNSQNTITLNNAIIDVYGNEKAESSANTQAAILLPNGATLVAAVNTENTVNLNSTTTDEYAFAIEGKGILAIGGKGTLNVNAKKASDESNVRVYGISTSEKLSISDLTLNVFGQYKAIYKGDQNTDNIEIAGGTINAKCNTANGDVIVEDNGKYAIQAEKGDIVISNGTVNAKGGAIGIIASNGKVAVSDGTVAVDSGTQGLYANTSVDITGGTVNATAHGYVDGQAVKSAKAIYSQGTIGISGTANVSATCINDKAVTVEGSKFYGIRAKGNITITGNKAVVTAKGTTAAFNLDSGKTVTANNAVIRAGENETSASVQTGDVTTAVTGNKYAKVSFEPLFDDRFGGTNLTKNSYTKGEVPTQGCHAKTQGYTFAGWSTVIDDESKIISGEPEGGKTYYAVWKNNSKIVVTQPMDLNKELQATDKLADYGYKYEAVSGEGSTLKLTLDGFTMDVCDVSGNNNAAMQINRNTNISLKNSNIIDVNSTGTGATGIYASGTADTDMVTIQKSEGAESGSLNIETEASGEAMTGVVGIYIDGPALEIKDAAVNAKAGEQKNTSSDAADSYGIFVNSKADDALGISDANVKAEAGKSTGCSFGILAQKQGSTTGGNITISNKAKVTAVSGNATGSTDKGDSTAILTHGNLTIKDADTEAKATSGDSNTYTYGIRSVGDTLFDGAKVTATAGNGTNRSYGIYGKSDTSKVTINAGSTVNASAGESTASYGIIVKDGGAIALNSGNVTAKGNTSALSKAAVFAGKVDAQASTSIEGTSPVDYEDADNSTYKWVQTSAVENGVCSIEKGGVTTEYSTLAKAVKAAAENDVIKITADIVTLKKNLTVSEDKKFTIDLNGKTIDLNEHHIICHGNLTVTDNTADAVGVIKNGKPTDAETANDDCGGAVALILKDPEKTPTFTLEKGTIKDCSANAGGAVFVGEGANFEISSNGTIDDCDAVYGGGVYNYRGDVDVHGTITNCTAENYGGGIYNNDLVNGGENKGDVELDSTAKITGCSADGGTGEMGGGIFNKGTLTMNGGTISGCSAEKGAGVHNDGTSDKVTFELNGGEIKDNTAVQNGGGIQNSANAVLAINGVSITGNKATNNYGGGVFSAGTLNFGNTAKITITGNKGAASKVNSNVAFANGKTGTVTSETLATDSSIGVMAIKKYGLETSYNLTENYVITNFTDAENSFFTSDDEDYELKLDTDADKIKFQRKAAVKGTDDVEHGTVSIEPEAPATGQEVTITATPDSGYDVGTIKVTDKKGNEITVTNGKFTMPTEEYLLPVTISVEFTATPTPTPATQYTVTFDNQGHGAVPQSQVIEKGGKVSDPGSLEAEGFIFGGWFTDKECTDAWDFDNDTVTKDITLYAKWTEEPQPAEAKEALMVTGTAKKTTNTIKWNAVDDADGYDVYYAKCGNSLKKVKSTTALKYTKKGLNKKKYYKYRVKAYETVDGNKVYLATSLVIHIAGVSAKYSNATKVTADPDGMNIEAGDTDVIKAKITKKSSKKTVLWKNHVSAKIRYMSTDSSVVTVDSKGNVTAIGAGEAYVYAYAASGAFAKITVTVQ